MTVAEEYALQQERPLTGAAIPITAVVPLQDQRNRSTQSRNSGNQNLATSPMSQAQET